MRLDTNLPIYQMSNFRTCTAQLKYIQDHKTSEDFFNAGQENDSAQNAQHNILVDFAEKGRASSIVPIMIQLQDEKQREPLLITCRGVIVNGNRRLAAMRELLAREPGKFRHFSHVDCAVLPSNASPDDLLEGRSAAPNAYGDEAALRLDRRIHRYQADAPGREE